MRRGKGTEVPASFQEGGGAPWSSLQLTLCSLPPALRRLRGWHDVDAEIEEILEEDKAEKAAGFISVLKLFKMRSLRWQVISIIVLMAGQQLSGVNAVGSRCWGWGVELGLDNGRCRGHPEAPR